MDAPEGAAVPFDAASFKSGACARMAPKSLNDDALGQGTVQTIRMTETDAGRRLDQALGDADIAPSRARVKSMIINGHVRQNGEPVLTPARKVVCGEEFEVHVPPPKPATPRGEAISLGIVYEDDDLIVVDKPAGLVVHPAAGHESGTLVNALIAHCGDSLSGVGGVARPGIVHRLDKDTTGLMVVAKNDAAHQGLAAQFASHGRDGRLLRAYEAVVWGAPRPKLTIDAPLARAPNNRLKMAIARPGTGRHAVTHIERFDAYGAPALASRIRCRLETGRTHQIRVHLASIGHPLLGDAAYGASHNSRARALDDTARGALDALARQALHAAELGFDHPIHGQPLRFEAKLPGDLRALVTALEKLSQLTI